MTPDRIAEIASLIVRVRDLHKQATTEQSHFYTASVLRQVLAFLTIELRDATLNEQRISDMNTALGMPTGGVK